MIILGYLIVAACLASCAWWKRPITVGGRLTLLLVVINALGWFVLLPQDATQATLRTPSSLPRYSCWYGFAAGCEAVGSAPRKLA